MPWLYLACAIVAEIFGTLGLRAVSDSLTWWVITLVAVAYTVSFAAMTVALRHLSVGVVYAVWSAIGIAAISVVGAWMFGDRLNRQAVLGLVVIVTGVAVVVTSGSATRS